MISTSIVFKSNLPFDGYTFRVEFEAQSFYQLLSLIKTHVNAYSWLDLVDVVGSVSCGPEGTFTFKFDLDSYSTSFSLV